MTTDEPTRPRRAKPRPGSVKKALILIDHGSKRDEANDMFASFAELVQQRIGGEVLVRHAHMELAAPSLRDTVAECVRTGAREIIVHPYMLAPGRHVLEDIPRLTAEAMAEHPGVSHRITPPLGLHPLLVELVLFRSGLATEK